MVCYIHSMNNRCCLIFLFHHPNLGLKCKWTTQGWFSLMLSATGVAGEVQLWKGKGCHMQEVVLERWLLWTCFGFILRKMQIIFALHNLRGEVMERAWKLGMWCGTKEALISNRIVWTMDSQRIFNVGSSFPLQKDYLLSLVPTAVFPSFPDPGGFPRTDSWRALRGVGETSTALERFPGSWWQNHQTRKTTELSIFIDRKFHQERSGEDPHMPRVWQRIS